MSTPVSMSSKRIAHQNFPAVSLLINCYFFETLDFNQVLTKSCELLSYYAFAEANYSTLQTSLVMTTQAPPRNGCFPDTANIYSQTLGHLPAGTRVLSPNFLASSQSTAAAAVLPTAQRPSAGRVVYVDSATGRVSTECLQYEIMIIEDEFNEQGWALNNVGERPINLTFVPEFVVFNEPVLISSSNDRLTTSDPFSKCTP